MQFNRIRYYVFFHDISLLFLSQFTRLSHFKKNLVKHEDDSLLISGILPESSQHSGVCRFDFLPIKLMQIMFSVAHPYLPFQPSSLQLLVQCFSQIQSGSVATSLTRLYYAYTIFITRLYYFMHVQSLILIGDH